MHHSFLGCLKCSDKTQTRIQICIALFFFDTLGKYLQTWFKLAEKHVVETILNFKEFVFVCLVLLTELPKQLCGGVLRNFAKFTGKHLRQSLLIKNETLVQVFSCEFCKIFKNTFFYRTPLVNASRAYTYSTIIFRTIYTYAKLSKDLEKLGLYQLLNW